MSDKEHLQALILAIASMSMASWNKWRIENPSVRPDLCEAEITDVDLSFANLSYADLSYADFSRSNLYHATLRHTDLSATILKQANLREADLSFSSLQGADLRGANLHDAILRGTNLIGVRLEDADLGGADFTHALFNPKAVEEGRRNRLMRGVTYLERFALNLFSPGRSRELKMLDENMRSHHSGRPN
jgi:uncharacterized protein YjbI with pentapeptide repeats